MVLMNDVHDSFVCFQDLGYGSNRRKERFVSKEEEVDWDGQDLDSIAESEEKVNDHKIAILLRVIDFFCFHLKLSSVRY